MPKGLAALVGLLVMCLSLFAQDERFGTIGQHSIEANYQFGRIIPHNKKFNAPITGYTNAVELNYCYQTLGNKPWQRKLKHPEVGASFYFAHHADQQTFGNVYAGLAFVKFWIVRSRYVDFYVRASTGLVVVPKRFNILTNGETRIIGSLVNSIDQVRLGLDFKPLPQLQVGLGATFTHYSNASVQQPNLGVNIPSLTIGLRYFPVVNEKLKYNRDKWDKPKKRHEVGIRFSMALHDRQPFNGPKYPVYIGTVNYAYYTSIVNKVIGGFSTEFNQSAYSFYGFYGNDTKYKRAGAAMNLSVFVGDEVLVGNVGLFFAAGVYVFNPRKDIPVYSKIGVNYYMPAMGKEKNTRIFVGSYMKAHYFVAQFWEITTGVVF